jgi:hypothetical protein
LAVKWKRRSPDRLGRLAQAIEAIAGHDQKLIDENSLVDSLRREGAAGLHLLCREFVDDLNARLTRPSLVLDPPEWDPVNFDEDTPNLFQISLRGRLLQLEFAATDEAFSTEDFRHRYTLRGGVRSFNQDFLEQDTVDEQQIFYCHTETGDAWHFFDARTYRTGRLSVDYLAAELERLL